MNTFSLGNYLKKMLLLGGLFLPALFYGQCNDLFFSEYIEGSSGNNKCLEIFNPTGSSISLDGVYTIEIYSNGNSSATTTINLSGTVAQGDIFLICHSGHGLEPLLGSIDQTAGNLNYNGNDAVALLKDGTLMDVIGQIGFDPGSQWGTDPTSTMDHVLTRKSFVGNGDENGSDAFVPAVEWIGSNDDNIEGFGSHSIDEGACDCAPPTAVCQDVTVNLSEGGEISVEDVDNGSTFDCGFLDITLSDDTFGCDELGGNTITLTATDNDESSSTCTATVTVIDPTPPTAVCMNTTTMIIEGNAVINGEDVDGGSSDNCTTNLSVSPNEFFCAEIGASNTVTLTVTDNGGNSATCTANVTVQDIYGFCCDGPQAFCMDATVLLSEGGALATADVDMGSSGCGNYSIAVMPNAFTCANVGTSQTVTLTVTDGFEGGDNCTATVTVTDDVPPMAVCQDFTAEIVEGEGGVSSNDINDGSSDNCALNFELQGTTGFGCEEIGNSEIVTLVVTDNSGNSSSCTATVTFEDPYGYCCVAPTLYCPANRSVFNDADFCSAAIDVEEPDLTGGCGEVAIDFRYRSKEIDDDPGSWTAWMTNPSITLPVGRWQIQWRGKDEDNNTDRCRYIIEVIDNEAPVANCLNNTVCLGPYDIGEFALEDLLDLESSGDNCGYSSSLSSYIFDCEDLGATKEVVVTLTDDAGNSTPCTAYIDVELCPALPYPWMDCSIGTESTEEFYNPCTDEFTLSTVGFSLPNYDVNSFVYQEICGDFQVIAKLESIINPGFGGILIREDCGPGSKKVALKNSLMPFVRREVRTSTNGLTQTKQLPRPVAQPWLRIERTGHYFIGYTSIDGNNWLFAFYAYVPMSSCVQVGLYTEGINVNLVTTANFSNVSINGSGGTLSAPNNGLDIANDQQTNSSDLGLYPNPTVDEINVDLNSFIGQEVNISVFNYNGQKVLTQRIEEVQQGVERILLNGLGAGTYMLRVQSDEKELVSKFVVGK